MRKKPLISVIIPMYNAREYVYSCLNNILSQSYENLDIIVVNDGSTDNSREIAEQFPITILNLEENKGLSAARNAGMDIAKGEYIHFMDVDDSINPDFYIAMLKAIISNDADIACSGMINEANSYKTLIFKQDQVVSLAHEKLELTYVGKWGYVWRYLFRTRYIREQNFRFEEGRFIEDLVFSLPAVFYANKVVAVSEAIYIHHYRKNSIMTKKDKAHRQKRHQDRQHAEAFRRAFAKQNNIKIPGVDIGRTKYIIRKLASNFHSLFRDKKNGSISLTKNQQWLTSL